MDLSLGVTRARLPRERGGTAVKDHLPPPRLPAIAGHGLDAPYSPPRAGGESPEPAASAPGPAAAGMTTANATLLNSLLGLEVE